MHTAKPDANGWAMTRLDEQALMQADIQDALEMLRHARVEGDQLKIDLREAALNDLIERYTCHTCHTSQSEAQA